MTDGPVEYNELLLRIDNSKKNAQRSDEISLVAVSKNQTSEKILELYNQGCRIFGESRVQELELKKKALPSDIDWHFIGSLQKNKVQKVVGACSLIHSVDSIELAKRISDVSASQKITTKILLEVNTSYEASKHGFSKEEVLAAVEMIVSFPGVSIEGLMTIGPNTDDREKIRTSFRALREIKESLATKGFPFNHLSMGMSEDFEIAIEEGATILRLGSLLFGDRIY